MINLLFFHPVFEMVIMLNKVASRVVGISKFWMSCAIFVSKFNNMAYQQCFEVFNNELLLFVIWKHIVFYINPINETLSHQQKTLLLFLKHRPSYRAKQSLHQFYIISRLILGRRIWIELKRILIFFCIFSDNIVTTLLFYMG